jgi:hypothetical protein
MTEAELLKQVEEINEAIKLIKTEQQHLSSYSRSETILYTEYERIKEQLVIQRRLLIEQYALSILEEARKKRIKLSENVTA